MFSNLIAYTQVICMKLTNLMRSKITVLILLFAFLSSCEGDFITSKMQEGVIHYRIEYPSIPADNYMLDLMPKEMTTSFSDGEFRSDISAGMGLFRTSIIFNHEQEGLVHSLKLLNKKYASSLTANEIAIVNPHFKEINVKETGKSKTIAGLKCSEVLVEMKGDSLWQFKLYYTSEINIDEPNRFTPFKAIDGVLMEYEMINYDTHMRFVAERIESKEINHESLKLEKDYEMVSASRLNDEIKAIFAKVK
mgnify:CR=1 FL=1